MVMLHSTFTHANPKPKLTAQNESSSSINNLSFGTHSTHSERAYHVDENDNGVDGGDDEGDDGGNNEDDDAEVARVWVLSKGGSVSVGVMNHDTIRYTVTGWENLCAVMGRECEYTRRVSESDLVKTVCRCVC
ncbi:uncharacterized protein [Physcomitrium patens]|uniref:uncharacterized protein n=1 Tax=Physcomitrium patens TaxID=3218 RepID=UPI003CCDBBDA